ncbi:hypothetical protein GALMADRAFT_78958 [Galerina marginata CBS 339.88]|uniref:DUF5648 domain-containing protein n=1 Tax=Galerina marginata (strain CBS 339.88) TaxID=685588 RepID=A0A067SAY1_GALM3|nr:hypothetical protein GALMADRAFT_78958 [Galerina marginata CBS 339.88]
MPSTKHRTTDTCGDPSVAEVFYEGFSPSHTTHVLESHSAFVNADAIDADWQLQRGEFLAWKTPQTGTLPFYRLQSASANDFVFVISTTGSPPVVSGFATAPAIIGYVYPTQICDSVPLFTLFLPSATDHYYTIDATERQELISFGWTDQGIAAYVLPA